MTGQSVKIGIKAAVAGKPGVREEMAANGSSGISPGVLLRVCHLVVVGDHSRFPARGGLVGGSSAANHGGKSRNAKTAQNRFEAPSMAHGARNRGKSLARGKSRIARGIPAKIAFPVNVSETSISGSSPHRS